MTSVPVGGLTVLEHIAAGRSPWHGWEAGHAVRTSEGQEAYRARAESIQACRRRGLTTEEGLLTDLGLAVLKDREAVHG